MPHNGILNPMPHNGILNPKPHNGIVNPVPHNGIVNPMPHNGTDHPVHYKVFRLDVAGIRDALHSRFECPMRKGKRCISAVLGETRDLF
jgi:hypothetical protein